MGKCVHLSLCVFIVKVDATNFFFCEILSVLVWHYREFLKGKLNWHLAHENTIHRFIHVSQSVVGGFFIKSVKIKKLID